MSRFRLGAAFLIFSAIFTWMAGHASLSVTASGSNEAIPIFISEVYYQASTYSARDKWVELYNPTDQAVSLTDYSLVIGQKQYRFALTRNKPNAFIPPYSTYVIEDSWGKKAHLLSSNGFEVDDTSGVLHWLSNVTTNPHLTLSLDFKNTPLQTLYYSSNQIDNWVKTAPYASLNCNPQTCTPSTRLYRQNHYATPGQVIQPVTSLEPTRSVQAETKEEISPQVTAHLPISISLPTKQPVSAPVPKLSVTKAEPVVTTTSNPKSIVEKTTPQLEKIEKNKALATNPKQAFQPQPGTVLQPNLQANRRIIPAPAPAAIDQTQTVRIPSLNGFRAPTISFNPKFSAIRLNPAPVSTVKINPVTPHSWPRLAATVLFALLAGTALNKSKIAFVNKFDVNQTALSSD